MKNSNGRGVVVALCLGFMLAVGPGSFMSPMARAEAEKSGLHVYKVLFNPGEVVLHWTATGDDGQTGRATGYDIRYVSDSAGPIDTDTEWNQADQISDEPVPSIAGQNDSMVVTGLTPGAAYYFSLKAYDEAINYSGLSNSPLVTAGGATLPGTPTPVSPPNGSSMTDFSPTLDWSDVTGADYYQVQVDNNSDFSSPERAGQPVSSTWTVSPDLTLGTWYWRARANADSVFGSWSTVWSFAVVSSQPGTPILLSPANGQSISDNSPTLDWNDVANADYFQVQVDNDSNFVSPDRSNQPTASTWTVTPDIANGTWFWRVRANADSVFGNWSQVWRFTITGGSPGVPVLLSPANGSSTDDLSPTLDWSDVISADFYQVQVDNNPDFSSPERSNQPTLSTWTVNPDLLTGAWFWRVRANDNSVYGNWSAIWSFIVTSGGRPGVPNLVFPPHGSRINDNSPWLDWSTVSGADFYQIQVDNSPYFSSPDRNHLTTASWWIVNPDIANGIWYWRVRAYDNSVYGDWSVIWGFVISTSLVNSLPGDVNNSGAVDGTDLVYLISYLKGGPPPALDIMAADVNGSCSIDGDDVTYLTNYLKGNGPALQKIECGSEGKVTERQ